LRILILVDCYCPSSKSGAKQIHDLGVELVRSGHEVIVMTPSPSVEQDIELSLEEGVQVARIRTGEIKTGAKAFRALREMRLPSQLWRAGRRFFQANPCDLVIFYSPTIFFAPLVRTLKKLWSCPAYLILRDIFPQWAVDAGLMRRGSMVYQFFRRQEAQQYAVADVITVQSRGDLDYFRREFSHLRSRIEVLHNWTITEEPRAGWRQHRSRLGLQGKTVFFYGGNIGVAQDLDNILRLAAGVADHPGLHFLLVGEGTEVPRLKDAIAARNISNITVLPAVAQHEYLDLLTEFDIGLITLDRRLTTHNIPGKLLGYFQCGLPVLASVNPGNDLHELIRSAHVGFCLDNGEDEALRAAALELARSAGLRARMGANGRKLLEENFSASSAVRRIFEHLGTAYRRTEERTPVSDAVLSD
jgi:glycosyltransferase involved in cell wall biosynthesis